MILVTNQVTLHFAFCLWATTSWVASFHFKGEVVEDAEDSQVEESLSSERLQHTKPILIGLSIMHALFSYPLILQWQDPALPPNHTVLWHASSCLGYNLLQLLAGLLKWCTVCLCLGQVSIALTLSGMIVYSRTNTFFISINLVVLKLRSQQSHQLMFKLLLSMKSLC